MTTRNSGGVVLDTNPDGWIEKWRAASPVCMACGALLAVGTEAFRCGECGTDYPVVNGVPRFVSGDAYAANFGYEWGVHRGTQVDSISGLYRSREAFLAKTGLTRDELKGAKVLDVGVGAGRFAEIAADLGGIVTGIDLTRAVDSAVANLGERAAIAQADLFWPPFADHSFDVVYSIGVLHHTPDTRAAFDRIARLVRPGGILAVWVYHPSPWTRFSDAYRRLTSRIPPPELYRLVEITDGLHYAHRLPVAGKALRVLIPLSPERDRHWRILDTFDWYSPKYQWKHRVPEVAGWFRDAGFEDIRPLPVPTAVRGRRIEPG